MTPQDSSVASDLTTTPVVLDTNVVLDWLLFDDPATRLLGEALTAGSLRWVATEAMRDELDHVLRRGSLDHRQFDLATLWARWASHCTEVSASASTHHDLRCTDPDDQKFIDLAARNGAGFLLSRDRAVLKLSRKLAVRGVRVATPAMWAAKWMTGAAAPVNLED